MALINGNFRGSIDGNNIWSYKYLVDHNLETLEKRIDLVKEILSIIDIDGIEFTDDKFWQEVFDMGICKSNINTSDCLWSETNICNFLENLGTYLITKDNSKKDKENVKIYDSYSEFKRGLQQESVIMKYGDIVEFTEGEGSKSIPVKILKNQKNYKLAPDIKISTKDRQKYPEIEDYYQYKKYLLALRDNKTLRKKLAQKININTKKFKLKSGADVYRFVHKQLSMVEDDMLMVKILKDKNIVWKSPLKDNRDNNLDWDCLDLLDPLHVKLLLQIPRDKEVINEICITRDDITDRLNLTDVQKDILNLWRQDKKQKDIGAILNITTPSVNNQLNKIVNKFIDKYIEIYEDEYYYVYLVKGKYKKCSKCGKVKLIQRFNKNNRRVDGYESFCKECQCK